jgi:diguanylate cyclase (GGDEF)-like protein
METSIIILQTTCALTIAICTVNILILLDIEAKKRIENHQKNKIDKYKKISEIDYLTKLQNRLSLQNIMTIEIARAHRYNRNLAILFIDIDDFKKYNDIYGHEEGDKVLIKMASVLRETLRETDYALRYGGDEFIALLPETDIKEAFRVAERFRNKFKAVKFYLKRNNRYIQHATVSIGVATYTKGISATELIQRADKEMYRAKKLGKNQTRILS